jgi:hypothetical protein
MTKFRGSRGGDGDFDDDDGGVLAGSVVVVAPNAGLRTHAGTAIAATNAHAASNRTFIDTPSRNPNHQPTGRDCDTSGASTSKCDT